LEFADVHENRSSDYFRALNGTTTAHSGDCA